MCKLSSINAKKKHLKIQSCQKKRRNKLGVSIRKWASISKHILKIHLYEQRQLVLLLQRATCFRSYGTQRIHVNIFHLIYMRLFFASVVVVARVLCDM